MDLTQEQLDQIVAAVLKKATPDLSGYATKEDVISAVTKVAEKIPANIDTSTFATKEFVNSKLTALTSVMEDAVKKVNEDIQKLVKKVFPEATTKKFLAGWWAFDKD